jgi:predicted deacylase
VEVVVPVSAPRIEGHSTLPVAPSGTDLKSRETRPIPARPQLGLDLSMVVQRKDAGTKPQPDLTIRKDELLTPELQIRVDQFVQKGIPPASAVEMAIDDAFAERVRHAGGSRVKPATPGVAGSKIFLMVDEAMEVEGQTVRPGLLNAAMDDNMYNCHSFTFFAAKKSKIADVRKLMLKAPPKTPVAGQDYLRATDLTTAGILFFPGPPTLIAPRWVQEAEARAALASYRQVPDGEVVKVSDIAVYNDGQGGLPHSGVVIAVDTAGRPTRLRSKWGKYSLFEHPPTAVPEWYGRPVYYRRSENQSAGKAKLTPVQRIFVGSASDQYSSHVSDSIEQALGTAGTAVDATTANRFHIATGEDVSDVQVHAGPAAANSARELQALAYTVGRHVVLSTHAGSPQAPAGQRLLNHELTHVVQQRSSSTGPQPTGLTVDHPGDPADREAEQVADSIAGLKSPPPITERPRAAVSRTSLDVAGIARDTGVLGPMPISPLPPLFPVFSALFLKHMLGGIAESGELGYSADYPRGFVLPKDLTVPVAKAKLPGPDASPPLSQYPVQAYFFPSMWPTARRALILGGFHANERPGWQVPDELVRRLHAAFDPELAFHTIVVPRVSTAAIADELAGVHLWNNRWNRQLVDLNRNFRVGTALPHDTDSPNTAKAPVQPEIQAVMDLITTFRPDRILTMHAISTRSSAGVFADPNQDPAAIDLARGMASTIVNESDRPHNKLTTAPSTFSALYPLDKPGVVSGGTTLGAWAPTATGRTIPVITSEAPGFESLAHGMPTDARTVEAGLRPVNAFLSDPATLSTAADRAILSDIDALDSARRLSFLTGGVPRVEAIRERIELRVRTAIARLNALRPPIPITVFSSVRLFSRWNADSGQSDIVFNKFFLIDPESWDSLPSRFRRGRTVDRDAWFATPTKERLEIIFRYSAMPGASRHHWSTDVDLNTVSGKTWEAGKYPALSQWLTINAPTVGLLRSYTPGRAGGYNEEPWHFSYAPIAVGLRQRYNAQVDQSAVKKTFIKQMEDESGHKGKTLPSDFTTGVMAIDLSPYINDIGPGL